jgi:hypothetical protein
VLSSAVLCTSPLDAFWPEVYIWHPPKHRLYATLDGPFSAVLGLVFSGLEASDFVIAVHTLVPVGCGS